MVRLVLVAAFAALALLLSACAGVDSVEAEFPEPLAGTRWAVIEWRSDAGMAPLEGLDAQVRFTNATEVRLTAEPGTTWSGQYEDRMAEFEQTFVLTDLEAGETKVPEPAARFAALAGATRAYVRVEDTLTLLDREGDMLLVLERR